MKNIFKWNNINGRKLICSVVGMFFYSFVVFFNFFFYYYFIFFSSFFFVFLLFHSSHSTTRQNEEDAGEACDAMKNIKNEEVKIEQFIFSRGIRWYLRKMAKLKIFSTERREFMCIMYTYICTCIYTYRSPVLPSFHFTNWRRW